MVDSKQLILIRNRLRISWKNIMADEDSMKVWLDSFRSYDFNTIENATIEYMKHNRFQPNPADIINCIPAGRVESVPEKPKRFVPRYEIMPDGTQQRVIKCRRCNDTGLIVWMDEEQRNYGRPCVCEAAIANYGEAVRATYSRKEQAT